MLPDRLVVFQERQQVVHGRIHLELRVLMMATYEVVDRLVDLVHQAVVHQVDDTVLLLEPCAFHSGRIKVSLEPLVVLEELSVGLRESVLLSNQLAARGHALFGLHLSPVLDEMAALCIFCFLSWSFQTFSFCSLTSLSCIFS